MAHFDHEGGNKTRFQAYDPAAIIVQKELDLAALPTGPLLGQEDPNSSDDDDDEISAKELFPDTTGDVGLLAETALNAYANEAALASDTNNSLLHHEQGIDEMMETGDDESSKENHAENPVNVDSILDGLPEFQPVTHPPRQRIRFTYAKKYFYCNSDLYLKVDMSKPAPDSTPDLLGQVVACPNKKNNNMYQIKWIGPANSTNWPPNLIYHVRTQFPRDQVHQYLRILITNYDNMCGANNVSVSNTSPIARNVPATAPFPTTLPLAVPAPLQDPTQEAVLPSEILPRESATESENMQTPIPEQRSILAELHTRGTSSSDHTSTTAARRTTRQGGEDVDSDGFNTEDEDEYNVDFSENFWRSRNEHQGTRPP